MMFSNATAGVIDDLITHGWMQHILAASNKI